MKTCTTTITELNDLTAADEPRSGAKAFNCARLKQAGFRVPDGLVVLADADNEAISSIADHSWFDNQPLDTLYAVRSSGIGEDGAGQSFAGIHETVLNVRRDKLAAAIAVCRASGHSAHAVEYRRARGISIDDIRMGVFIQRMVQPIAAGVAFTANPVTGRSTELVINSSWGVGEALVSGQVDPDEFVVRKDNGELLWSRAGEKGVGLGDPSLLSLSSQQVRELADILIRIEMHYGSPQDVEWCHDKSGFWIVQSRPVTTEQQVTAEPEWTRANLVEVLPDLTSPQALDSLEALLNSTERAFLGKMASPDEILGPMLKAFNGRLYFNLSQSRRVCALSGIAPAEMLRSMGHAEAIKPADEKPSRLPFREIVAVLPDMMRMLWRHFNVSRIMDEHNKRTQRDLFRFRGDPARLSDDAIWADIEEWLKDAPETMKTVLLLSGVMFHELPVRKICAKVGFPFERLVYPQLATGERSVSAQQAFDLLTLADMARRCPVVLEWLSKESSDLDEMRRQLDGTVFLAVFERFLQNYGHRGRYESDWSLPRYHEDPSALLYAIRAHIRSGSEKGAHETVERQRKESAEAWDAFTQRLSLWQTWTAVPRVRTAIRKIKQYYLWREQVRSDMMRVMSRVRAWSLVLAKRFVDYGWLENADDYFMIHLEEVAAAIKGEMPGTRLRELAAMRKAELERNRTLQMPLLMRESELANLIRIAGVSNRTNDESQMTGHPVSGGCVEAEVVVVRDPADFGRMKTGAILVAPATDPSWTPLFTLASGVIVEVGGVLSHASTVAREYGLPALANVKHATRRLRTGERIRLDATNGVIQRL